MITLNILLAFAFVLVYLSLGFIMSDITNTMIGRRLTREEEIFMIFLHPVAITYIILNFIFDF